VSAISIVCSVFLISSDLPTYIWVKERMSMVVRVHLDFLLCHLTYTALVFPGSPPCIRTWKPLNLLLLKSVAVIKYNECCSMLS
jgi:hypothetical protein